MINFITIHPYASLLIGILIVTVAIIGFMVVKTAPTIPDKLSDNI